MVLPTPPSRQVLAWSLPTLAFVLSILWYRRRHRKSQTDPGGTPSRNSVDTTGDLVSASADLEKSTAAAAPSALYFDNKLIDNIVTDDLQSCQSESSVTNLRCEVIVNHSEIPAVAATTQDISVKVEDIVVISSSPVIELDKSESDQVSRLEKVVEEGVVTSVVLAEVESAKLSEKVEEDSCIAEEALLDSTMTEVEEQSSATIDPTTDVSEAETPTVLSKISVDVVAKNTEEEEDVKNVAHQPRDSANHSPAEAMLASPSMSNDSDTHSVGSNDSGKGGSDVTTPVVEEETEARKGAGGKRGNARNSRRTSTSSRSSGSSEQNHTPNATVAVRPQSSTTVEASSTSVVDQPCIYEFVIPQQLVGRLIGKHGCFVQQIKNDTSSSIFVKRHPESPKYKVCAIEGTQTDIEEALKLIRKKFPTKKYPGVTLERVLFFPPVMNYPLIPESLQVGNMNMYLVECVNNDVILSSLVSAGHMFIQQPTHPTFPVLSRLIMSMTQCYSEDDSPTLPNPAPGIVCAAPSQGAWYRAEVIDVRTVVPEDGEEGEATEETTVCDIKFVDYGGFMTLPCSELRQIRTDFMMLPFQATECYLADVTSIDDEEGWSVEATQCVEELTRDQVLQAQVIGYAENCIPFVRLFSSVQGPMAVMVNEVLVHRGLAKYFDPVSA